MSFLMPKREICLLIHLVTIQVFLYNPDKFPENIQNSSKDSHMNRLIWHLLIVLLLNQIPVQPCTVIAVKGSGGLLVGNNEDASPEYPTKVWFLQPEAGPYGYLIFGFADGFAQGGLNDQGLVVGWTAGYETDWSSMPDKPNYPDNLTEKMLAECASVDEALVIFRHYNVDGLQYARCMLADKEKSAIILWQNGSLRIIPWDGRKQILGYGEGRAEPRLARSSAITVPELQSVMTRCIQRRPARTLYSVVYDLENRVVTVFNVYHQSRRRRSRMPAVQMNLIKELEKGNHFYDLPDLAAQMEAPPRKDGRTIRAIAMDPEQYQRFEGVYADPSGNKSRIFRKDNLLLINWSMSPWAAFALYPRSEKDFFARYRDFQAEFILDAQGAVTEVIFKWTGRLGMAGDSKAIKVNSDPRSPALHP